MCATDEALDIYIGTIVCEMHSILVSKIDLSRFEHWEISCSHMFVLHTKESNTRKT